MAKVSSKGVLLKLEIATVLTTIGHLISVNGPGGEVQQSETPTLDQAGPGIPHDITGWVEPGTSEFEVFYDPALAVHIALTELKLNPAISTWQQAWPVGDPIDYDGILTSLNPTAAVGEFLKASGSIQLADLFTIDES